MQLLLTLKLLTLKKKEKVALNTKSVEVENKIPKVLLLLLNSKYVWM